MAKIASREVLCPESEVPSQKILGPGSEVQRGIPPHVFRLEILDFRLGTLALVPWTLKIRLKTRDFGLRTLDLKLKSFVQD